MTKAANYPVIVWHLSDMGGRSLCAGLEYAPTPTEHDAVPRVLCQGCRIVSAQRHPARAPKFAERSMCGGGIGGPTTSCEFGPSCGLRLLPVGHEDECSLEHDFYCVASAQRHDPCERGTCGNGCGELA